MTTEADLDWAAQRQRALDAHARAQADRRAREAERAAELIGEFVRDAAGRGIAPVALTAAAHRGSARYRTGLHGWYLDRHRSLGVDTGGRFYLLNVPNSTRARLTGVTLEPQPAPLVIGRGGRDGESIPLDVLLRRRLAEPVG
ncbi:hypothetical protein Ais01nite_17410 [Asanoa ishikariensis]|uniref:Uncharacterized protein n=1 Tax=Asanoa ishikariensis TaxID=137265 RepID=A0A1H3UFR4_9ACTN|nr:hypothetical protein [Asanoa ishikariensis]GIF63706.1 hypothetical protein Ais01nite_17410 [Asanoa ishikariensis]SDZ60891.1 hypothetical protein SAMN05421684_7134 [Asanoa ishikariensis]